MLKKWKLQSVLVYSLAIIVWVNNFQTPEIQAVLNSFFCDGNDSSRGSNRGGGWGWAYYRSTKCNMKTIESNRSRLGFYWTFFVLTALQIEDNNRALLACPALQAPIQGSHEHLMVPKHHSRFTQGLRKAATKTRLMTLEQGQQ